MQTTWTDGKEASAYGPLKESVSADVVIIGGGLAGVMSAYVLSRAGKKVVLLEKGTIGAGVTHMTTAFVTQIIDTGLSELVAILGTQKARLVLDSGGVAIDVIQEIIEREHIECDFSRCSAYVYAHTEHQFRGLIADHEVAEQLGLATTLVRKGNLPFPNAGYLEVLNQAKFQPLVFLRAVAQAAVANGVRIFEHTPAATISETGPVKVVAANGAQVQAEDIIVATHVPFNKPKALRFKKALYRSYVLEAHLAQTDLRDGLYWDRSNPYTYFRVDHQEASTRIIFGGADHRADIPFSAARNMRILANRLHDIVPSVPYTITNRWHGPILESVDGLPFIGAYAPHRYLATAFSGNGMTYSVVSSLLLTDLIGGKTNVWAGVYEPTRKLGLYRLYRKGMDYMNELLGGIISTVFRR